MNPIWAIFFKDRIRTPFSVYKMSLAEVAVLGVMIFGIGYGITKGVQAILTFEGITSVEESPTKKINQNTEGN